MKHRDRLLRAALRLVDVNRCQAEREDRYVGDLAFLEEVDAVIDQFNEEIDVLNKHIEKWAAACSLP